MIITLYNSYDFHKSTLIIMTIMNIKEPASLAKKTSQPDFDYTLKLIIIGDSGVGKSSIMLRFNQNKYVQNYTMTIGINYVAKTILIEDKMIRLQIWDTAGQQKYKTITQNYYRNSQGAIIAFSINSRQSFDSVRNWIDQLMQTVKDRIEIALVGTKKDLEAQRQVTYQEAEQFAKKSSIVYLQCSAKNGESVNQVFAKVGLLMKKKQIDEKLKDEPVNNQIKIMNAVGGNVIHKKCCLTFT